MVVHFLTGFAHTGAMKFSPATRRLALVLALASLAACTPAPPTADTEAALGAVFLPRKSLRIAVVGAGPSGLTAADTLQQLGYQNVTVFEKNDRVGGKVYSYQQRLDGQRARRRLRLARLQPGPRPRRQVRHPLRAVRSAQSILDEHGVKQSAQTFLTSRYTTLQILGATVAYGAALTLFAQIQQNGLRLAPARSRSAVRSVRRQVRLYAHRRARPQHHDRLRLRLLRDGAGRELHEAHRLAREDRRQPGPAAGAPTTRSRRATSRSGRRSRSSLDVQPQLDGHRDHAPPAAVRRRARHDHHQRHASSTTSTSSSSRRRSTRSAAS